MSRLTECIANASSIAILGHVNPDGDCVGSCLGLYNYIRHNYDNVIKVKVFMEKCPDNLSFLDGFDDICNKLGSNDVNFHLVICSDVSCMERIGIGSALLETAEMSFCIDHHVTNDGICTENIIDGDASSASEVVYRLLDEEKIDRATAECLYTGIVHDTGVFKYPATTCETMYAAGTLMKRGFDFTEIIDGSFYRKSFKQLRVCGYAFEKAHRECGGKACISSITWKEMEKYGVTASALNPIVSDLRNIEGVEAAAFIYQTGDKEFKVSLRSNKYLDCTKIAARFGGGGHIRSAGCTVNGDVDSVTSQIVKCLEELL